MTDTQRELHDHTSGLKTVVIRHRYATEPEDLWDAITDPDRLVRWFLPISGDLREGGRFSLEGNASGTIVRCDRPREIVLTWEIGDASTDVWLRLVPEGDATVLELEHSPVQTEIITNVGETWGLGPGWELSLGSLEEYVAGGTPEGRAVDRWAAASPEEMAEFVRMAAEISDAWTAVIARAR
jgi:uncharacterized protein YndB with AHSA1/START domain